MLHHSHGIYILASDPQYDQLLALIHSIAANVSPQIPICVIPGNDSTQRIEQEIAQRDNLSLFDDAASLARWESFGAAVWQSLPVVNRLSQRYAEGYGDREPFRRFCAFDGPFEKFVFYDVASLAMKPLDDCWAKLEDYDFVVDDWQHCRPLASSAFNRGVLNRDRRAALGLVTLSGRVHGSSWFGAKRGAIDLAALARLRDRLIHQGEAQWLNALNWWSADELFSYMTLRCQERGPAKLFNYSRSPNLMERTGNCALGDDFVAVGPVLYSVAHAPQPPQLKPIHRLNYGQYSSFDFALLCEGETVAIPYDYLFCTTAIARPSSGGGPRGGDRPPCPHRPRPWAGARQPAVLLWPCPSGGGRRSPWTIGSPARFLAPAP
ncbi:MAG: methionine synthase [Synechococcales cyanobacterium RM1_1_8]|nr:methionine synthase [Synechococcales cyanobacterium RM1_1_8]